MTGQMSKKRHNGVGGLSTGGTVQSFLNFKILRVYFLEGCIFGVTGNRKYLKNHKYNHKY